jgi:triosephosphate isomerase
MRKKLFAGNWKMNLDHLRARALVRELRAALDGSAHALAASREVMVAPPFPILYAVAQALAGSDISLGAQNMHSEDQGAYTGEVSPLMLRPLGVRYVILGHSERRKLLGESDDFINKKVKAALKHRLHPILCVGETTEERRGGRTLEVVLGQVERSLAGLEPAQIAALTIAYEPIWAIGTGVNATPEQAQEVHGPIRDTLENRYGKDASAAVRVLYGGSVTPDNVEALLAKPDIDGALVGGASLKADSFSQIVKARLD